VHEQPNDQIVPLFGLGKTNGATYQPLDPRPQLDGLALDFLRVVLANSRLIGVNMTLVGPPPSGVIPRDATGLQQSVPLQKTAILPPPKDIRQSLATAMVAGMPEPTRMRVRFDEAPHFVTCCAQSATHLKLSSPTDFPLHLFGLEVLSHGMMHLVPVRCLLFHSLSTVVGLLCQTRAGSRMPLACMAIAIICCFTSGD
jgi:hypothetical protein